MTKEINMERERERERERRRRKKGRELATLTLSTNKGGGTWVISTDVSSSLFLKVRTKHRYTGDNFPPIHTTQTHTYIHTHTHTHTQTHTISTDQIGWGRLYALSCIIILTCSLSGWRTELVLKWGAFSSCWWRDDWVRDLTGRYLYKCKGYIAMQAI